jgi:hypothetical protein
MTLIKWTFKISQPCSTTENIFSIVSPVINLATFWIYVTHDNKLCIKNKKFTSIFNNKLNKRCFLLSTGLRNLEGPFYESHYLYESKNTDAKFKHLRSRMSVEMILWRGSVNEMLFGYSRDFPFQLTNITVVVRTRKIFFNILYQSKNCGHRIHVLFMMYDVYWYCQMKKNEWLWLWKCIKSKKFTSIFNNKLNKRCFLLSTGLRNFEGPFYESHYLYESKNTDAKFKHLRSW